MYFFRSFELNPASHLLNPCPTISKMITSDIQLKGLSPDQISNLLPEGLISLCWRGSVAHGMYVPKSDPDSIDDNVPRKNGKKFSAWSGDPLSLRS
ncbi:MAG: hypothetical protein ACRD6N_20295 [Pyrinomonadaceae bacterium]